MMNSMQAMVNGLSAEWQKERAEVQMTLGELISVLSNMDLSKEIVGLGDLHSYRGYYCDLAFEPINVPKTVADLISQCKAAMGEVFEGYKGGDYVMGSLTPLWVAEYGSCGSKLMSIKDDGTLEVTE